LGGNALVVGALIGARSDSGVAVVAVEFAGVTLECPDVLHAPIRIMEATADHHLICESEHASTKRRHGLFGTPSCAPQSAPRWTPGLRPAPSRMAVPAGDAMILLTFPVA